MMLSITQPEKNLNSQQGTPQAIVICSENRRYHFRENQWDYIPARGPVLMNDRWDGQGGDSVYRETNGRSMGTRYGIAW